MKQKVLKRLGLLALSTVMVVPNVLVETKAEAYPKLSTKDAGKNPKKESTVKAKSGSGFFGKLFKLLGGVVAANETHNLIRTLIGNPYFCSGMAQGLFDKTNYDSLAHGVLNDYKSLELILMCFQRKIDTNKEAAQNETGISQNNTQTKPVFQGILTPMSEYEIREQFDAGYEFAKNHPHLALLILKRFDAMLAMGIDIFKGKKPFDSDSSNPIDQMYSEPPFQQEDIVPTHIGDTDNDESTF